MMSLNNFANPIFNRHMDTISNKSLTFIKMLKLCHSKLSDVTSMEAHLGGGSGSHRIEVGLLETSLLSIISSRHVTNNEFFFHLQSRRKLNLVYEDKDFVKKKWIDPRDCAVIHWYYAQNIARVKSMMEMFDYITINLYSKTASRDLFKASKL